MPQTKRKYVEKIREGGYPEKLEEYRKKLKKWRKENKIPSKKEDYWDEDGNEVEISDE